MTIDSIMAQMEQMTRTVDWFGPPKRPSYCFDPSFGKPEWLRPPEFSGTRIVVNKHMARTKTEVRLWRERLFSRPWRPWRKLKTVPDKPLFFTAPNGTIYTCQRGADALCKAITS